MIANRTTAVVLFTLVASKIVQQVHGVKQGCNPDEGPCDRRLSHISSPLSKEDMKNMLKKCVNRGYNVAAAIELNHLGLVATPNEVSQDCPVILLDDDVFNQSGKRITSLTDPSDIEDIPKYDLGSFSLAKIFEAFNTASDSSGKEYNLLENNCGKFTISMVEEGLNIPITSDHIAFVANTLLQEDKKGWVTSTLRAAELFASFFAGGDQTSNDLLMHQFVADYVESVRNQF